jgi:DNA-binding MarR family transcriptional regulator
MEETTTPLDCAHAIIRIVPRLSRVLRKDLRRHSAGVFTEPQFRVMARLYREGGQSLSDLAQSQGVSLPTMSKLTQGMEARGLVFRERDDTDKRKIILQLTEEGRRIYESLLEHTEQHIVEWIQGLDAATCRQIIESLQSLNAAFEKIENTLNQPEVTL